MADFNIDAARKAKYTDAEIGQYLQQSGRTPAQVAGILRGLDMRPTQGRPLIHYDDPATLDKGLADAAQTGFQVALPLGLGALGGPAAMTLKNMFLPAAQATLGGIPTDPDVEIAGIPDPKRRSISPAQLTGPRVLREAAKGPGKFGGFASYVENNPTAGEDLFDLSSAEPAISGRPAVPRLDPTIPPKKGVSARMLDAFQNPKVVEGLKRYMAAGDEAMPQDWYATSPLWKKYQAVWGDRALDKFVRDMGYSSATSSGMRVPDNIRTGTYYSYLDEQGLPIPKKPAPGYGSKMQQTHREGALEIRNTGDIDPFANPKRAGYRENLLGNEDALTADRHFVRLVGMLSEDPRFLKGSMKLEDGTKLNPRKLYDQGKLTMEEALKEPQYWEDAPAENEYMHAENEFRKIANGMGYTTANGQGKAWVGGGQLTGLGSPPVPWMRLYAQRVAYTAARLGVDPKVVLDKVIRGQIPLLGIGAAGAGLGLKTGDADQQ